jgi:hypothetical protein
MFFNASNADDIFDTAELVLFIALPSPAVN